MSMRRSSIASPHPNGDFVQAIPRVRGRRLQPVGGTFEIPIVDGERRRDGRASGGASGSAASRRRRAAAAETNAR